MYPSNQSPEHPSTPVAESSPVSLGVPLRATFASRVRAGLSRAAALLACVAAVVMFVRTYDVEQQLDTVRTQNSGLQRELELANGRAELLQARVDVLQHELEVQPAVPPTNDKLFAILGQGVSVTEDVLRTTTVGTTPDAAFATDLTTAQRSDAFTQEMLIANRHATQNLCVGSVAWSAGGGATCTLKCAASGLTCSGASTDGFPITPGSSLSRRYDGSNCVCLVGSGAGTTYTDERIIR